MENVLWVCSTLPWLVIILVLVHQHKRAMLDAFSDGYENGYQDRVGELQHELNTAARWDD